MVLVVVLEQLRVPKDLEEELWVLKRKSTQQVPHSCKFGGATGNMNAHAVFLESRPDTSSIQTHLLLYKVNPAIK